MHHHELVDNVHRLFMDNCPTIMAKTSGWTTFNCSCVQTKENVVVLYKVMPNKLPIVLTVVTQLVGHPIKLGGKYKKLCETLGVPVSDIHKVVLT